MLGITATTTLMPGTSTRLSAAELPLGATLSILADPVQVEPSGGGDFIDAVAGQSLLPGDIVRTGDTGIALLTFFDGSESQLAAGSQVQIEQADYTPAPQIALFQSSGVSVNRVIPLPPGGSFRTDTPDATGLVRGTSYVVSVAADEDAVGTAVTLLTDLDGHVGRVQVVPPLATTPISSVPTEAIVTLSHAGDLGSASVATGAARPAASHVDDAALARLEQAAHNLHDADSARTTSDQARQTLRTVAPAPLTVSRVETSARLGQQSPAAADPDEASPRKQLTPTPTPSKAETSTPAVGATSAPAATEAPAHADDQPVPPKVETPAPPKVETPVPSRAETSTPVTVATPAPSHQDPTPVPTRPASPVAPSATERPAPPPPTAAPTNRPAAPNVTPAPPTTAPSTKPAATTSPAPVSAAPPTVAPPTRHDAPAPTAAPGASA